MRVWAQSSQRSTWPPSAAVRQTSIAVMTRRWARLRCALLAARQAAPWRRKTSATSSFGRDIAGCRRGRYQVQVFERALDLPDQVDGNAGIARGRLDVPMQVLDDANVLFAPRARWVSAWLMPPHPGHLDRRACGGATASPVPIE